MTAPADDHFDAIVIGAGISGLAAATELARAGCKTIILEKSRGIGGRMATRRVGAAVCDHGAQFFTVRTRAFAATVTEAEAAAQGPIDVYVTRFTPMRAVRSSTRWPTNSCSTSWPPTNWRSSTVG